MDNSGFVVRFLENYASLPNQSDDVSVSVNECDVIASKGESGSKETANGTGANNREAQMVRTSDGCLACPVRLRPS